MKTKLVTGIATVATPGTAVQLTSTAHRAISVHLEGDGSHISVVGDSSVVYGTGNAWAQGTSRGIAVSDGSGNSGEVAATDVTAAGAQDVGRQFYGGTPTMDLSAIYLDGNNGSGSGTSVTWTALVMEG